MPADGRSRNHVLLLRHCVRSTGSKIGVCDRRAAPPPADNATSNDVAGDDGNDTTATKERYADLTEFLNASLPEWDVPEMWCTERGMDVIEDLGRYLVTDVIAGGGGAVDNVQYHQHQDVVVNIVSDTSHRDVDTSLALLKGMKHALAYYNSSVSGLDEIRINHEAFGYDTEEWSDNGRLCPTTRSLKREVADRLSFRLSRLPPSDFGVDDAMDLVAGLDDGASSDGEDDNKSPLRSLLLGNFTCPGHVEASLTFLKDLAHMTFYSRASRIDPPFLPAASVDDVYKMLNVAEYVNSVEHLDNKISIKYGLIMAKSMLDALWGGGDSKAGPRSRQTRRGDGNGDKRDSINVTIFVGHDTNIWSVASSLGLRWAATPPYAYRAGEQIGKIVTVPPGSGILLSADTGDDDDVSMSYIVPVNLMDGDANATEHRTVPIYTIDMAEPEFAIREKDGNGSIASEELRGRLEATMARYPDLRGCYENAPAFSLGIKAAVPVGGGESSSSWGSMAVFLAAMAFVNVIGCSLFLFAQVLATRRYRYRRVSDRPPREVELR